MNDRLQIATQLMAAMLQQAAWERYDDFRQFGLQPDRANALALHALSLADALLRVDKELSERTSAEYRQGQERWQDQKR
jgi:hypothetical protein